MTSIFAMGVMTGTSGDGADAVLLRLQLANGGRVVDEQLLHHCALPFPRPLRARILKAQEGGIDLKAYGALQRDYSLWLASFIGPIAARWRVTPASTILGVHGQTLWHEPPLRPRSLTKPGYSIQMLDGALVAQRTGFVTVSQFRQPDLAWGGQGAPLAPTYHRLLARDGRFGPLPIAVQNIGGIGNMTYLGPKDRVLAFDTGPGNALMDLAAAAATGGRARFDQSGRLAAQGHADWDRVQRLSREAYFKRKPPKSTGRELFNEDYLKRLGPQGTDAVATATALTAYTMALAYSDLLPRSWPLPRVIYVAGGGALNPTLMQWFAQCLRAQGVASRLLPLSSAGIDVSALESAAFARFSVEAIMGNAVALPAFTGGARPAHGAAVFGSAATTQIMRRLAPVFAR